MSLLAKAARVCALLIILFPAAAWADELDTGDTAWMLTSTVLVLFMTLRRKERLRRSSFLPTCKRIRRIIRLTVLPCDRTEMSTLLQQMLTLYLSLPIHGCLKPGPT